MAGSISEQLSKSSGVCSQRTLLLLRAYSIKILTMSLIHKNERIEDYKSPKIMVIDIATECGFASSDPKPKVGIDPYEYEEDLYL